MSSIAQKRSVGARVALRHVKTIPLLHGPLPDALFVTITTGRAGVSVTRA